ADVESGSEFDARASSSSFAAPGEERRAAGAAAAAERGAVRDGGSSGRRGAGRPSGRDGGGAGDEEEAAAAAAAAGVPRKSSEQQQRRQQHQQHGGGGPAPGGRKRPVAAGDNGLLDAGFGGRRGGRLDDGRENCPKDHAGKRQALPADRWPRPCRLGDGACPESDLSGFESADELTGPENAAAPRAPAVPDAEPGRRRQDAAGRRSSSPDRRGAAGPTAHKLRLHRHIPRAAAAAAAASAPVDPQKPRHPPRAEGRPALAGGVGTGREGDVEGAGAADGVASATHAARKRPAREKDVSPPPAGGRSPRGLPIARPEKAGGPGDHQGTGGGGGGGAVPRHDDRRSAADPASSGVLTGMSRNQRQRKGSRSSLKGGGFVSSSSSASSVVVPL
ncbi:MAG: hypothetical protein BJ554DRAFT_2425, partial [Olpidium bornovanus]